MSAFIVEDKTINRIVGYIRSNDWPKRKLESLGFNINGQPEKLGRELFQLNIRAVSQRYEGRAEDFRPLDYKYVLEWQDSLYQVLKSLRCFLYQCSEGDCPETELYKALDDIANSLAYEIVSELPEYEKAVWE